MVGHHKLWDLICASPRQRELCQEWLSEKAKELMDGDSEGKYPDKRIMAILGLSPSKEVGEPEMMKCKHNVIGIHCAQCLPGKVQYSDNLKEDCGWDGEGECPKHMTKPKDSSVYEPDADNWKPYKPKDPEVWCEHCIHSPMPNDRKEFHLKGMKIYCDEFKFCPICGTPRPDTVKTLAEKFHEYMETFSTHIKVKHYHDKEGYTSDEQVFHKAQFSFVSEKLAEIAFEHFKEPK